MLWKCLLVLDAVINSSSFELSLFYLLSQSKDKIVISSQVLARTTVNAALWLVS